MTQSSKPDRSPREEALYEASRSVCRMLDLLSDAQDRGDDWSHAAVDVENAIFDLEVVLRMWSSNETREQAASEIQREARTKERRRAYDAMDAAAQNFSLIQKHHRELRTLNAGAEDGPHTDDLHLAACDRQRAFEELAGAIGRLAVLTKQAEDDLFGTAL